MQYTQLGRSDIRVSTLCLGAMGWGTRNTETEAFAQIERSLEAGCNFIDTAEMYPTYPVTKETAGDSERIIGNWFEKTGRRGEVVLATKIVGPNGFGIRGGAPYDGAMIGAAVAGSLERLKTDVIDLYQLHWPTRAHYHFRKNWSFDPSCQDRAAVEAHMLDVLQAMQREVDAGRVRTFGLSHETAWGTMMWLRLAEQHGLPRMVSIQNEYSLMCRSVDTDLAEVCCFEDVGLLPFTPMVAGLLSQDGQSAPPAGSRRDRDGSVGGRVSERLWPAAAAYRAVAQKHGLDVNQMALAWSAQRPFVASSIFGASSMAQLDLALAAGDLALSDEVKADIDAVHQAHPMPF